MAAQNGIKSSQAKHLRKKLAPSLLLSSVSLELGVSFPRVLMVEPRGIRGSGTPFCQSAVVHSNVRNPREHLTLM